MSINLAIEFSHTGSVSQKVRYARIDNTNTPTYINVVPNPVTSPAVIATNLPNGQYAIEGTPVYPDGRVCEPTVTYSPACSPLLSINAVLSGTTLVVSYLAPPSVPKVKINISYPNGGQNTVSAINNGNDISIGLPSGVYGDFAITGQSICDESTQFYSVQSSTVIVNVPEPVTAGTIFGTIDIVPIGGSSSVVSAAALKFNLISPINSPLTLQLAATTSNSSVINKYGSSLIPLVSGTNINSNFATIIIPANQLTYTTPTLIFAPSTTLPTYINTNPDDATKFINGIYLKPTPPNDLITLSFTCSDGRVTMYQI